MSEMRKNLNSLIYLCPLNMWEVERCIFVWEKSFKIFVEFFHDNILDGNFMKACYVMRKLSISRPLFYLIIEKLVQEIGDFIWIITKLRPLSFPFLVTEFANFFVWSPNSAQTSSFSTFLHRDTFAKRKNFGNQS